MQLEIYASLVILVQNDFNERFWQVFTRHPSVIWTHLYPLKLNLTIGHFHQGTAPMARGLKKRTSPEPPPPRSLTPALEMQPPHVPSGRGGGSQNMAITNQVAVHNSTTITHLLVGPGLCLHQAMDMATNANRKPLKLTDNGMALCLIF